ncbi:ATP-binding protein [Bosea sp. BH3]|uniref:ATP-binding protein n=1 Tax=Bosea sp. BH3 TaxID=2871701 RepID=UPI002A5F501F|nr:histidine kinase [Bosea sp. BH3]
MTAGTAEGIPSVAGNRVYRAGGYVLVQALIALCCVLLLRQSPPEAPARYRLTEAMLVEAGGTQPANLPHHYPSRFTLNDPPLYRLTFERQAGEAGQAWSVFLPRFTNGVEVAVNGAVVLDSRRNPDANRPDRNTPEIASIPAPLLREGANELTVRLFVWGPLTGFLDRLYVGPDEALRPAYSRRAALFLTLPVVFSSWQAILAVILGIMWLKRRHEPAYGILAAAMALGTVQAFVSAPMGQSLFAGLNALLVASAPLESAFVLVFVLLFLGLKPPPYVAAIFIPGLLIVAIGLLGSPDMVRRAYLLLGPPTVGFCLVAVAVVVARSATTRRDAVSLFLGSAITVVMTCWVHDMLSVLNILSDRRIFIARLSYSALLVAIGAGLTWRFASALNEVDSFAGRMVGLVREAEDKLRTSFAREEERARAAALAAERTRLMRDLHDGLGGQLVSIVALSERNGPGGETIGEAARGALRDLRLVIDAMDEIDGDLMLALGSWRERTEARLRPHGIVLDWRVLTPEGLPLHPELRPWQVIQILRLLDEAVTNAVKHAGARRIFVGLETVAPAGEPAYGRITVEDDGHGFVLSPDGESAANAPRSARGLTNMRKRAATCGARLAFASGPAGTRLRLDLPLRFPDAEEPVR